MQTVAIIQPDNRGHFHEKGGCEESERSGPEHLLRHVASPQRGRDHECDRRREQGYPERSQLFTVCLLHWGLLVGFFTELKCSFVSSTVPQAHLVRFLHPSITTDMDRPQSNSKHTTGVKMKITPAAGDRGLRTSLSYSSQLGSTPSSHACFSHHEGGVSFSWMLQLFTFIMSLQATHSNPGPRT